LKYGVDIRDQEDESNDWTTWKDKILPGHVRW
jgi:hypothetical protein